MGVCVLGQAVQVGCWSVEDTTGPQGSMGQEWPARGVSGGHAGARGAWGATKAEMPLESPIGKHGRRDHTWLEWTGELARGDMMGSEE